jgi:hypothetical protein
MGCLTGRGRHRVFCRMVIQSLLEIRYVCNRYMSDSIFRRQPFALFLKLRIADRGIEHSTSVVWRKSKGKYTSIRDWRATRLKIMTDLVHECGVDQEIERVELSGYSETIATFRD